MTDMIVPIAPMRSPDTIASTIRAGLLNNFRIVLSPNSKAASDKILRGIAQVEKLMSITTSVVVEEDQIKVLITKEVDKGAG